MADVGDQALAEKGAADETDEIGRHDGADDERRELGDAHAQRQQGAQHGVAEEYEGNRQEEGGNGEDNLAHDAMASAAHPFGQDTVEGFQLRHHAAVHRIGPIGALGIGDAGGRPGEQLDRLVHRFDAP